MDSRHTPTPWSLNEQTVKSPPYELTVAFCGGAAGCSGTDGRIITRQEAEANAALIVRAVNAHDDLVAALRNLISMADFFMTDAPQRVAIEEAQAALAKAEGK
jgi:hypothetical protein